MSFELKSIKTRFRAYQLGEPGSSFSYFADEHFTLVEARLTERSFSSVMSELEACGKTSIDTLHITSWDQDHCDVNELEEILASLKPKRIEYPGYEHDSKNYKNCLREILRYRDARRQAMLSMTACRIDPPYIKGLEKGKSWGYKDIVYHPKELFDDSNDNSTVKLFRGGMFSVASLGDAEHPNIGSGLRRCGTFSREVDILILAHHGSDNHLNSKRFLRAVRPTVSICSSDYDNQYGHPHDEVKKSLYELGIPVFTTKTGDVLIESVLNHRKEYRVTNFKGNTTAVTSENLYISKKFGFLRLNTDSIRNRLHPGFKGLKK